MNDNQIRNWLKVKGLAERFYKKTKEDWLYVWKLSKRKHLMYNGNTPTLIGRLWEHVPYGKYSPTYLIEVWLECLPGTQITDKELKNLETPPKQKKIKNVWIVPFDETANTNFGYKHKFIISNKHKKEILLS